MNDSDLMRLLIMSTTDFGKHEIKPNFYEACARKVFPEYGIQPHFLPDPRTQPLYRYLKKFRLGSGVASTLTIAWWTVRNRKKFDVILGWHGSGTIVAIIRALFCWRRPSICLILYRLYNPNCTKRKVYLKRFLLKLISNGCNILLAVDHKQAAFFERELDRLPGTTTAFRYGIDYEWFENYLKNFSKFSKRRYIFCPGSAYRNDTTLIKAISDMEVEVKRFQLRNERVRGSDLQKIGKATVRNTCNIPYVEYVSACLSSAVVIISVYNHDKPAGLTTLLECMALGRPIIITRGLSSNDYVINGVTALEYKADDWIGLQKQISKLLENHELAEEIARTARETLKQEYNLDKCGAELAGHLRRSMNIG